MTIIGTGNTYGHKRGACPRGSLTCTGCAGPAAEAAVTLDAANPRDLETAHDPDAYSETHGAVYDGYKELADRARQQSPNKREDTFAALNATYVAAAIAESSRAPIGEVPAYRETAVNYSTGKVYGSATAAADARVAARGGTTLLDERQFVADRIADRAFDTRAFTTSNGVPMRARIVRKGEFYGRTGEKVTEHDTIFFFDSRYDHAPMIGSPYEDERERNGQFITSYHVDTILEHGRHGQHGLALDSHADWQIDSDAYRDVHAWLSKRAR